MDKPVERDRNVFTRHQTIERHRRLLTTIADRNHRKRLLELIAEEQQKQRDARTPNTCIDTLAASVGVCGLVLARPHGAVDGL
jgi:hypothetical protein